ncbi:hypothetical protein Salat_0876800 [Sesamum alatum]|uniref:Uncharacterized protein n=1 Tax=Sesamum alatum TaxID=300844 RepID=A0AAE2CQV9_9LAMI|nr:hypothetical protein Salat_0876800 [Sesamum alatum]
MARVRRGNPRKGAPVPSNCKPSGPHKKSDEELQLPYDVASLKRPLPLCESNKNQMCPRTFSIGGPGKPSLNDGEKAGDNGESGNGGRGGRTGLSSGNYRDLRDARRSPRAPNSFDVTIRGDRKHPRAAGRSC